MTCKHYIIPGAVEYPDGKMKVVVTGGMDQHWSQLYTTQILDLESNVWTREDYQYVVMSEGVSVPYKNTFLIVGGRFYDGTTTTYQLNIVEFDPTDPGLWIQRTEQLTLSRFWHTALLVPDNAVDCS